VITNSVTFDTLSSQNSNFLEAH